MNKCMFIKSKVLPVIFAVAVTFQQGCLLSPSSSSPIVGSWSFSSGSDVCTGTIYHYSSRYGLKQADTTFDVADLTGTNLEFASGGTIVAKIPFFTSTLTLDGTWSYSDADSNLTMKIPGTSVWPDNRTGKLVVSGSVATITYAILDTISHGISTFGTFSDTTSDVLIGIEVIKMSK